jgi:hypothetical protein
MPFQFIAGKTAQCFGAREMGYGRREVLYAALLAGGLFC